MKIKITFPDGSKKEYEKGITPLQIAEEISKGLAKEIVSARLNDKEVDLNYKIMYDSSLIFYKFKDDEGKKVYWHSTSHIMAQAVKRFYPDVKVAIGPAIENGFYYDFDKKTPFSDNDLEKIEEEMQRIIDENFFFERREVTRNEALEIFKNLGEDYKIELINELPSEEQISIYVLGDFVDLCKGPHLLSTNKVKAFKLLKVSGAYWRGDEKNKMLQRIYGISFPSEKELKTYLEKLNEAEKRDHRRLGKELDLFGFYEEVGAGLVHWHPKGGLIRNIIEDFWKKEHYKAGYDIVYTPHIGKSNLWETSGHLGFYSENMYAPMKIDEQDYYIRPMNCPFHIMIYKSKLRSYRELPIKYAELGTVYRYERSGVLHGLMRVRGFTQDDAHIICTPSQLENEVVKLLDFSIFFLKSFGFENFEIFLSTRPDKFVGKKEDWDKATQSLKNALEISKLPYKIDEGEGVFYGPKIDIKVKDALNRSWQCTTLQFDFNLPEQFGMKYIGEDNKEHRPFMIHRALLGSLERFFGVLIEHYAGNFPLWLAPVQVKVIPISENHFEYGKKILSYLKEKEIRAKINLENEKIGYKIREAENEKIPYMIIVGDKEIENQNISVRKHLKGDLGVFLLGEFIEKLKREVQKKTTK
ncbi:MAG: threonine--tRNA ligase [Candidatus Cloacimonetes bacterium]|nr:threonine--tRNA ligase [Candidatus Cloacimonadota bacterium]MBL7085946.1 threonine--tRNA ligase [Candidatus Cloacimonadota bacterium]